MMTKGLWLNIVFGFCSLFGAENRQELYFTDFDGKGTIGWETNDGESTSIEEEKPTGTGTASGKVLSIRLSKKVGYTACELPLHGKVPEPKGYDGYVSFKIYNSGFKSFYAMLVYLIPSDLMYRAPFKAKKGEWTEIEIPYDKFKRDGERTKRGGQLERFVIVGESPEGAKSFFQLDDVSLYMKEKAAAPQESKTPVVKTKAPEGAIYFQSFDDPEDFDIESFAPYNPDTAVKRIKHNEESTGKPESEGGCLKISLTSNFQFIGSKQVEFSGQDVIEFDLLSKNAGQFFLIGKSGKGTVKYQPTSPKKNAWKHYKIFAKDFYPMEMNDQKGKKLEYSKEDNFKSLLFRAMGEGKPGPKYLLIDNLLIREEDEKDKVEAEK